MPKFKLSGGASTVNSIAFFFKKHDFGFKATRFGDGSIVTEKVHIGTYSSISMQSVRLVFIMALLRELILLLHLPNFLFHVPTVFWSFVLCLAVIVNFINPETRMNHGAEHKVAHWYNNNKTGSDIANIQKCSRIHRECGSNQLGTIVAFQIASSICFSYFNIRIPEIITALLPFFVYQIPPFNILGLLAQLLTTAEPKKQHIELALAALNKLEEEYS